MMTKEEMRLKMARAILEAMIYTAPEDPQLYRTIGDLLASAPQGAVRVTISVEECEAAEGERLHKEGFPSSTVDKDKVEMLSVLGVRLRVDNKNVADMSSNGSHRPRAHPPHDYILVTPSSDTPPASPPPADAPAAP